MRLVENEGILRFEDQHMNHVVSYDVHLPLLEVVNQIKEIEAKTWSSFVDELLNYDFDEFHTWLNE